MYMCFKKFSIQLINKELFLDEITHTPINKTFVLLFSVLLFNVYSLLVTVEHFLPFRRLYMNTGCNGKHQSWGTCSTSLGGCSYC